MNEISTKEVEEAAYLWTFPKVKFQKVDLNKGGTRSIYFIFSTDLSEEEIGEIRRDYFNAEGRVEPRAYAQRQVDVRNILHEALRRK